MNNKTSIEKIHNYYEVSKYLDEDKKKQLQNFLKIDASDLNRLSGLQNEDEFKLMVYLLGNVCSITGIGESDAQLTKTKTTDVFIETKDGRKLSIEIKSSRESKIKFTKKLVEDKVHFSEGYGREAYFAIKLKGHWMLFSADYILSKNCKISIEDDFFYSELDNIFGERLILFPKGLELLTTYSHKEETGVVIQHKEYGRIVRIAIKIYGKRKFLITKANQDYLFLSYVLENVEDVMSNQHQEVIKLDENRTLVVEKFEENANFLKLSAFLMAPIKHMINDDTNELHNFQTFMETIKTNKNQLNRQQVLATLNVLAQKGYHLSIYQ